LRTEFTLHSLQHTEQHTTVTSSRADNRVHLSLKRIEQTSSLQYTPHTYGRVAHSTSPHLQNMMHVTLDLQQMEYRFQHLQLAEQHL